jgi:hypothetical protein
MQVFDASSSLYAWDNYPIEQFPKLWEWLGNLVKRQQIVFAAAAFNEIGHKSPECSEWLEANYAFKVSVDNAITKAALDIQTKLGILQDNYGNGVDENDIFVIATAKIKLFGVVSDEAIQSKAPTNIKNSKIPLVCSMNGIQVPCKNFITYLKISGVVFG